MFDDLCGAPVSLDTPRARTAWNAMVRAVLSHGTSVPDDLAVVLKDAPQCAMAHAAKGLFCLLLARSELVPVARDAAKSARAALDAHDGALRERLWVSALERWLAGSPSGAVAAFSQVLDAHPGDTLTLKMDHGVRFILGDAAGMLAATNRAQAAHGPDHPLQGFHLGCHAFALEETGDYARAEATGRKALALAPDDAWGLHSAAHVCDMTARADDGIALLETNTAAWAHCNNFRYHVWWHKALLHLDTGDFDAARALYDTAIRADKTDDYRDIANATSLLMRLELEGVSVGDRWQELADLSQARSDDACLVFADLHYMLALAGAGRTHACDALRDRVHRTDINTGDMARVYAHPGRAALSGLAAFAEARYDAAFAALLAARPSMQDAGGSHAQRDIFERMTIDAALRAGFLKLAKDLIADRQERRGGHRDGFARNRLAQIAQHRQIAAQ